MTNIDLTVNPAVADVKFSVVGCQGNIDCDDGIACNGLETCDILTGECLAGENREFCSLHLHLTSYFCSVISNTTCLLLLNIK